MLRRDDSTAVICDALASKNASYALQGGGMVAGVPSTGTRLHRHSRGSASFYCLQIYCSRANESGWKA